MTRVLSCLLLFSSPLLGAPCTSSTYQITGSVRDANGNPIADASVFLLLDVVSEKKFHEHGMRAARFRTNGAGRYHAEIACKTFTVRLPVEAHAGASQTQET